MVNRFHLYIAFLALPRAFQCLAQGHNRLGAEFKLTLFLSHSSPFIRQPINEKKHFFSSVYILTSRPCDFLNNFGISRADIFSLLSESGSDAHTGTGNHHPLIHHRLIPLSILACACLVSQKLFLCVASTSSALFSFPSERSNSANLA